MQRRETEGKVKEGALIKGRSIEVGEQEGKAEVRIGVV